MALLLLAEMSEAEFGGWVGALREAFPGEELRVYPQLGDETKAAFHRKEHAKFLPDYNAQDHAVSVARRANPAADHAAQATVIYPLQRPNAPGLDTITNTISTTR